MQQTNKTITLFIACFMYFGWLYMPSCAMATTYYVAVNGTNTNSGSYTSPWSFDFAVSAASPVSAGDVILVKPGRYHYANFPSGQIKIGKSGTPDHPITIKGEGYVEIQGNYNDHTWSKGVIAAIRQHDLVIDNFHVRNAGFGGIIVNGCRNIVIKNCSTWATWATGIGAYPDPDRYYKPGITDPDYVVSSYNIKVLDCFITEAQRGVITDGRDHGSPLQEALDMWGVDGFEIAGCTLVNCHKEGIDCKDGSRNGKIHHNVIRNQNHEGKYRWAGIGIYIDGAYSHSFNIEIYNNEITNKTGVDYLYTKPPGIGINDEQIVTEENSVTDVRIYNNVIHNVDGHGIWIASGIRNIFVYHNTIVNVGGTYHYRGIYVGKFREKSPRRVFIFHNIVRNARFRGIDPETGSDIDVGYNMISCQVPFGKMDVGSYYNNITLGVDQTLFVRETGTAYGNDFHLRDGSPAIDVAEGWLKASFDFDGNPRPNGGGNIHDMGAYEYDGMGSRVAMAKEVPKGKIIAYPVPTHGQGLNVLLPSTADARTEVLLYNSTGKAVLRRMVKGNRLRIPAEALTLPNGIYLLKANLPGQAVATKRVMITQ